MNLINTLNFILITFVEFYRLLDLELPDELIGPSSGNNLPVSSNTSNGTITSVPSSVGSAPDAHPEPVQKNPNKQLTKLLASPPRTVNTPGTPSGNSGSPKPVLQGMGVGGNMSMNSPVPNRVTSPRPTNVPNMSMGMNQVGGMTMTSVSIPTNNTTMVSYATQGNMQQQHNINTAAGNLMAAAGAGGVNKVMMQQSQQNGPFSIANSMRGNNNSIMTMSPRSTVTTTMNPHLMQQQQQAGMGNMQQLNQHVMNKVG